MVLRALEPYPFLLQTLIGIYTYIYIYRRKWPKPVVLQTTQLTFMLLKLIFEYSTRVHVLGQK